MVTKLGWIFSERNASLILAKIHMVTKHFRDASNQHTSLILAKIHMVTKHMTIGKPID